MLNVTPFNGFTNVSPILRVILFQITSSDSKSISIVLPKSITFIIERI